MSTRINYATTSSEPRLTERFQQALAEARKRGAEPIGHIIAGAETHAGEVREVIDPTDTSRVIARFREAGPDVISSAVSAATKSKRAWRATPLEERVGLLKKAARIFEERLFEVAAVVAAETGKSRLEALGEAQEAVDLIDTYADQAAESRGFRTPMGTQAPNETNTDVLVPYGVFAVIGPFNFPVALCVNMSSAALITGNTVVLKPSDKAPRSGQLVGEILASVLPPGVINTVHGGVAVGQGISDAAVDGIAFTGSAKVGWEMVRKMHQGDYGRPVLAEMGGKNVAVVSASADLDAAAEGIVRSAFGLSGQKCSACSRVVVEESVADALLEKLAERARQLKVGDPSDEEAFMGPVIDRAAVARFDTAVHEALEQGAVVAGGNVLQHPGYFVEPTIVTGLPRGHRLTREELFLPFLTVTRVGSFDDALEEANDVKLGLSAGVYSSDPQQIDQFLDEIEAGVLYVNRRSGATTGAWPGIQSFCGWKGSGSSGKGGLGPWYLHQFMKEQSRTVAS